MLARPHRFAFVDWLLRIERKALAVLDRLVAERAKSNMDKVSAPEVENFELDVSSVAGDNPRASPPPSPPWSPAVTDVAKEEHTAHLYAVVSGWLPVRKLAHRSLRISDIQPHMNQDDGFGRFNRLMIRSDGQVRIRGASVDWFARWLYPVTYGIYAAVLWSSIPPEGQRFGKSCHAD